jgi:hypothetical protein
VAALLCACWIRVAPARPAATTAIVVAEPELTVAIRAAR